MLQLVCPSASGAELLDKPDKRNATFQRVCPSASGAESLDKPDNRKATSCPPCSQCPHRYRTDKIYGLAPSPGTIQSGICYRNL